MIFHLRTKQPSPFIFLLLLFAFILLTPTVSDAREFEAYVYWVVDGDSIKFEYERDGQKVRDHCRMLHYNAPEMTGKERSEGKKSLRKMIKLVAKKRVMISGSKRDKYGRLLCEVRLMDGTYINDVMREFLKNYKKRDIYLWMEK